MVRCASGADVLRGDGAHRAEWPPGQSVGWFAALRVCGDGAAARVGPEELTDLERKKKKIEKTKE